MMQPASIYRLRQNDAAAWQFQRKDSKAQRRRVKKKTGKDKNTLT